MAGAPPRTSTAAIEPCSHKIAVQPVTPEKSVECPTFRPGTSVISSLDPKAENIFTQGSLTHFYKHPNVPAYTLKETLLL